MNNFEEAVSKIFEVANENDIVITTCGGDVYKIAKVIVSK